MPATAFDPAAFWLSMIAPVKKSVNHSRTVASMRKRAGNNSNKKLVFGAIRSTVGSEFAFGRVGHCFLCCSQFFSAVMWSLRFPFFWFRVCHYMLFTTLRTRPVNIINGTCTCSSIPGLLTHFTFLDAGSQAVFLFRRPTRLKEGLTLQSCVCRRVYIFK